jgi:hypothetical protein
MIMLAFMYFLVGLLGWPLVLFIFIGLADLIFDYRSRRPSGVAGPRDGAAPKPD